MERSLPNGHAAEGSLRTDAAPAPLVRVGDWTGWSLVRLRVALALFALNAIVTLPWAIENWGVSALGILNLFAWLSLAALALPVARGLITGRMFWCLLAAGLLLPRLLAATMVEGATLVGDPGIYEQLARELIAGQGLSFHDPLSGVDFRALYPPAYPLFLAALGTPNGLGASTILAGNIGLDAATALLIVAIGARLGSAPAGRAAAWLFAIWPAFVFAAPFAQKESLVTFEVFALSLLLLRVERGRLPSWIAAALAGLAAGALALTQPGLIFFPVILGLLLAPNVGWRTMIVFGLRSAPFALLLLAPWWVRNFQLLGAFVPLTSTGGLGLWIGNNPDATGNWMPLPEHYRGIPELQMSRLAAQEALQWIAGHPADFVRLTFFKLFHTMGIEQFTLGRFGLMTPKPAPATLAALFPLLQGSLIALLAGTALLGQRMRLVPGADRLVLMLGACAIQLVLFSLPFEFGERHRFFLMPFLFLLLALALGTVQGARPDWRFRQISEA